MLDLTKTNLGKYIPKDRLTQKEEEELFLKIRANNDKKIITQKIVCKSLPLVISIAKKYSKYGMEIEDLISEGIIGLLTAITRYDQTKGPRFLSFATIWIKQAILRALNEQIDIIRIPINKRKSLLRLLRENDEKMIWKRNSSFDFETIEDNFSVEEYAIKNDLADRLKKIINSDVFSEKEKAIIQMRYTKQMTLQAIGLELEGLSKNVIRKKLIKIQNKIKVELEKKCGFVKDIA